MTQPRDALYRVGTEVDQAGFDRISGAFGGLLNPIALVTGAIVGAGTALVALGNTWQDVERIIRVGTGAIGEALEEFRGDVEAIADEVPDSLGTIAAVVADLNTNLGLTGEPLQELSIRLLDLSRLTNTSVESLIAGTRAFENFNIAGEDNVRVLEEVLFVSQQTGIPIERLLSDLTAYGPVLANANLSLTETIAFFGSLNEAGVNASRVMPGVNALFRRLAEEGVEDLGAALAETIDEIANAESSTIALNLATQAFGAEGAQRMTTAIRTGALTAADLNEELVGLAGATADADDQILDIAEDTETLGERWGTLINTISTNEGVIESAGIAFGLVEDALIGIADFVDEHGEEIEGFFDATTTTLGWIVDNRDAVVLALGAIAAAWLLVGRNAGIAAVAQGGAAGAATAGGLGGFAARAGGLARGIGPVGLAIGGGLALSHFFSDDVRGFVGGLYDQDPFAESEGGRVYIDPEYAARLDREERAGSTGLDGEFLGQFAGLTGSTATTPGGRWRWYRDAGDSLCRPAYPARPGDRTSGIDGYWAPGA